MRTFYLDSSALAKRYLTEIGSAWVTTLVDPAGGNTIVVAEITRVEVAAALSARQRATQGLSLVERNRLFQLLVLHCTTEYTIIPITAAMIDQAMLLTQNHRLRGYDAVQLATALDVQAATLATGLPGLTFLAADDDLITAARTEGLPADNPRAHP
jgi:hypothetical protein